MFYCFFSFRTKCQGTEEEEIEKEFKQLFPNYHEKDFNDLRQKDLDDDEAEEVATTQYIGHITLDDVKFVFDLHSKYVRNYTKSEWLRPEQNKQQVDFVAPLMEKFKIFKLLLDKTVYALDYVIDGELLGALNVLTSVAQNYGETNNLIGKF